MAKSKFSVEEAFEQLDEILQHLEEPKISLSDSMEYYKKGVKLLERCNLALDKTEKEMILVGKNSDDIDVE